MATGVMVEDAEVRKYHDDGFLIVRGVFPSAEMEQLSDEARRLFGRKDLIDSKNMRCRWQNHHETGECRFDTFDPIIDLSPTFDRIARDPRIMEVVGALYGEPACLFKDKLIYKPPGATGYGLHQDFIAWPNFPRSFVTVLVPLDPSSDENGATEVFPGYHKRGCLSTEDGDYHQLPLSLVDETLGVRLCLEPGDLAIFSGMTPHRSAPNTSDTWRRQLYLSYNAFSDGGERREAHYQEFHVWLKKKYAEYGKQETYFE